MACSLAACTIAPPTPPEWEHLPGWQTDEIGAILPELMAGTEPTDGLRRVAQSMKLNDESAARLFLRRAFAPAQPQDMLYTGYFTITLPGALAPSPSFPVPVLRRPSDAQRFDRAAIMAGALAGLGLELVWLRNAADLFFLQLQGSGLIILQDGGRLDLVSAGSNGRAPVATERLFGNAGIENNDLSIPSMRAWIAANPHAGLRRLMIDPSYVFFRKGAARGASGAALAPLRSIAVDPRYIPLGRLLWVKAGALRRIMVASDTGAPISGAHRADIFFGAGAEAEDQGGRLYESGMAWQLVPKGAFG